MVIAVDPPPGAASGSAVPYPNSIKDGLMVAWVFASPAYTQHSFDHEVQHNTKQSQTEHIMKHNTTQKYRKQIIHYWTRQDNT